MNLLDEQQVHVDGEEQGDEEEGRGAEQLVHGLVSDHGEGAGVVEHMVVPMVLPEPLMHIFIYWPSHSDINSFILELISIFLVLLK